MPRPASDITGKQIQVAVRVTSSQKEAFKRLGGAVWLRKQLSAEMEERWEAKQQSIGQRIISRVLGR
jgi:hypothetical protein